MFDLIIKSMEIGYEIGLIYGGKYKPILPCCDCP
jgi:hypothetical protein